MMDGVHGNEGPCFEVWFSGPNCAQHDVADCGRQDILGADLNDASTAGPQGGQQHAEIQVECENDPAPGRGEIEYLSIGRPGLTCC
jgi:hypothetical protein